MLKQFRKFSSFINIFLTNTYRAANVSTAVTLVTHLAHHMTNRQHIFLYFKPFSLYNPKLPHFHIQQITLGILTYMQTRVAHGATRPAGRSGPHDPTTMTTDLSCFSLLRVREYLIKWKFVITHLHQFTETQFHERIP